MTPGPRGPRAPEHGPDRGPLELPSDAAAAPHDPTGGPSGPDLRAVIAERLVAARELAGLSQGQAAKLLKLHRPTISEIEAGRRRVAAEELTAFARLYAVSLAWLAAEDVGESASYAAGTATGDGSRPVPAARDRGRLTPEVELAARELAKLSEGDRDRVLALVSALRLRPASAEPVPPAARSDRFPRPEGGS